MHIREIFLAAVYDIHRGTQAHRHVRAPLPRMSRDVSMKVRNKAVGTVALMFMSSSLVDKLPVWSQKTVKQNKTKQSAPTHRGSHLCGHLVLENVDYALVFLSNKIWTELQLSAQVFIHIWCFHPAVFYVTSQNTHRAFMEHLNCTLMAVILNKVY